MWVAVMCGLFCAWIAGTQRYAAVPLVAAIAALAASQLFKPWGLVSSAALFGVLLGGAIFQVFTKRRSENRPTNFP
jgi:hypothetical protein